MRKILAIICLVVAMLAGCHHLGHCTEKTMLAATFPIYIFTTNICAGVPGVKTELLIPAQAGCPHNFSLRPADLRKLAGAEALIINGCGLDEFLAKPLEQIDHMPVMVNAGAYIPTLIAPGGGVNGHVFAAPAQAALMVRNIGAGLAKIDPEHEAAYTANAETYAQKLENLAQRLAAIGAKAKNPRIAIEHDALAYLAANAGLEIVAYLESPTSASQVAVIIRTIKETRAAVLAGDAQFPRKMLEMLAQETEEPFVLLDTCASGPENAAPDYYETIMARNAANLERAFE